MRAPAPYRALLALLPRSFREEYGEELDRVVLEHWADVRRSATLRGRARFWLRQVLSIMRLAVVLRFARSGRSDEPRYRWGLRGVLPDLGRDLAYAWRTATRSPLFTLLAILMVALGTGANVVVYRVARSVLVDGLPYAHVDRLVRVWARERGDDAARSPLSPASVVDVRSRRQTFEAAATFLPTTHEVIYRPESGPRALRGAWIGPDLLDVVGVVPALGRSMTDRDLESGSLLVMLSHDFWVSEFGGDPGVIGRTLQADANGWEIIGVLPPGFVAPMGTADLWFGLNLAASLGDPVRARARHSLGLIARVRPGLPLKIARSDLAALAASAAREHPETDAGWSLDLEPLRHSMAGDVRTPLMVLLGGSALVLLILCANLGGAIVSRTLQRRKELAVRAALGAGRARMLRQMFTESIATALAGAVVGLVLAGLVLSLVREFSVSALPVWAQLELDRNAIVGGVVLALVVGILVGLPVAIAAGAIGVGASLRESARSVSEGPRWGRVRGVLVTGQIALCLGLLVGAGLLARSLFTMVASPLGFDPDSVLTFSVKGPLPAPDAARREYFDRLEERVRSMPGVLSVAHTSELPRPSMTRVSFGRPGMGRGTEDKPLLPFASVSDDWFRAMRIPVLRGRTFDETDVPGAPRAVVVSRTAADRYWPGSDAIGARVRIGPDSGQAAVVIGIVGDIRNEAAQRIPEPMIWGAVRQASLRSSRAFAVRTGGDPLALVDPIRRALAEIDGTVPATAMTTLRAIIDADVTVRRIPTLLVAAFAVLALLLASVGIYALFASVAAARAQEYGLRLALGSTPFAIATLAIRQGGAWMLAGLAAGVPASALAAYAIRGLLYDVSPLDPVALAGAMTILVACAGLALLIPVRRAARVESRQILH